MLRINHKVKLKHKLSILLVSLAIFGGTQGVLGAETLPFPYYKIEESVTSGTYSLTEKDPNEWDIVHSLEWTIYSKVGYGDHTGWTTFLYGGGTTFDPDWVPSWTTVKDSVSGTMLSAPWMNPGGGRGDVARGKKVYYEGQTETVNFGAVVIGNLRLERGAAVRMAINNKVIANTQSGNKTDAGNVLKHIKRKRQGGQAYTSGTKTDYFLLSWEEIECRTFLITYGEQYYLLWNDSFVPDGEPVIHTITQEIINGYNGACGSAPVRPQPDTGTKKCNQVQLD